MEEQLVKENNDKIGSGYLVYGCKCWGLWVFSLVGAIDLKRFTCYVLTAHGREAGKKGVILRLFGDCRFKNDREIYKFSQIEREIF